MKPKVVYDYVTIVSKQITKNLFMTLDLRSLILHPKIFAFKIWTTHFNSSTLTLTLLTFVYYFQLFQAFFSLFKCHVFS